MEANVYTIPVDRLEAVQKVVARYQRKAEKYGAHLNVSYGEPRAVEVKEWMGNDVVDRYMVEAVDVTIDSDIIRNGNYSVIARLEHMENANIVTTFGDVETKDAWRHADCRCEHCGMIRDRKLTFIVRDGNGNEKQVGRTCLKDYCGIDPNGIGIANELRDVFLDEDINEVREYDPDRHSGSRAYNSLDILSLAISITKTQGYVKSSEAGSNKSAIFENVLRWRGNASRNGADRAEAEAMAAEIMQMSDDDNPFYAVLPNVKALLEAGYCKENHFGYFAYAPTEFKKYMERKEEQRKREAAMEAQRKSSEYVGIVGKRQTFSIASFDLITSWETQYGMTYLYKFITTDGNVLVWFASQLFGRWEEDGCDYKQYDHVDAIKATVKDHTERDGVKQTIITRCKAA